jgi:hypothetical protein
MCTLGNWTALLVDMLQRSVGVLAIADSMTPYTGLTGIFFAFDQHLVLGIDVVENRKWVACRPRVVENYRRMKITLKI